MLRLSDNNTPTDLAIRNRVDGIRLTSDAIGQVHQALAAHTPPYFINQQLCLRGTRERIDKRGHAVEVNLAC